ncbi:MAG TPA: GNAT family N-acetyltransferase [Dehalococcoidia bacterium]|nr:GNAT family N-acetyltransferase [Dehalococcoidia bacterium]
MEFDPALSLRILNNERLRRAHWGEYIDLRGALALTSDAPLDELNCIETFSAKRDQLAGLLDIGFSLLRAYDRMPAVHLTPLDRPKGIEKVLRARGLVCERRTVAMALRDDAVIPRTGAQVEIRIAGADDVLTFRDIVAPASTASWLRTMTRRVILDSLSEPWHTFYIGCIDGQPAGTLHLLVEGSTAGIYAVATLRSQRRRGVQTSLLARAIADARAAGCDLICLRTAAEGDARRLFEHVGFEVAHEQTFWVARG